MSRQQQQLVAVEPDPQCCFSHSLGWHRAHIPSPLRGHGTIWGGGASGALIGTNPDVVQGEPAAVLIQSALVSKTHSHRFKL